MVYQDTTLDGTKVYVYSPEEHAEALVNKELCQKAQKVLGNVSPNV